MGAVSTQAARAQTADMDGIKSELIYDKERAYTNGTAMNVLSLLYLHVQRLFRTFLSFVVHGAAAHTV